MNKTYIYIIMCVVAIAFSACKSDDDLPVQHPDGYGQIQFSVQTEQVTSRAASNYTDYDAAKYPATLGVFGWADDDKIFNNANILYNKGNWLSDKYWEDYADKQSFKFYGYMPYIADATVESESSKETLSFTFAMPNDSCMTFVQKNAPLMCNAPKLVTGIQQKVDFQMDQTLTGFRLEFALGDKMDKVRDISIKSVKLRDVKDATESVFVKSGKCSREYTKDGTSWTGGEIKWTDIVKPSSLQTVEVYNAPSDSKSTPLKLTTSMQQWGSTFFTIPATGFTPYIEVTYDVSVDNNSTITRESVTSSILLNKKNFSKYDPNTPGTPGTIYPIQIKIVPSYLYVLADADQATGYIVINQ